MSTLRSALDELRGEDLEVASEEELGEGLVELERASRVLEAERSRRLVEVERRGAWAIDGHLSVVSWLAARVRVGFGRATQQVKLSRALRAMPETSRALGTVRSPPRLWDCSWRPGRWLLRPSQRQSPCSWTPP